MARWTTNSNLQRKHQQRVKQSMKTFTMNKYMKGFTRMPKEPKEKSAEPEANDPTKEAKKQDAPSTHHNITMEDMAYFYAKEEQKLAEIQKKKIKAPKKLKARGFSAVAAYAEEFDYTQPPPEEPKPLKYDYTKLHPSWLAKYLQRKSQENIFGSFKGTHIRLAEEPDDIGEEPCKKKEQLKKLPRKPAPSSVASKKPQAEAESQIYIRGFPEDKATWDGLQEICEPFGEVKNIKVHWSTSMWCSFAFVTFVKAEDAQKAVEGLNGLQMEENTLVVHFRGATEKVSPKPKQPVLGSKNHSSVIAQ